MYLSGAFANSWENRRCRFIVHIADLSARFSSTNFPNASKYDKVLYQLIGLHMLCSKRHDNSEYATKKRTSSQMGGPLRILYCGLGSVIAPNYISLSRACG